jgi:hypothetical protein
MSNVCQEIICLDEDKKFIMSPPSRMPG